MTFRNLLNEAKIPADILKELKIAIGKDTLRPETLYKNIKASTGTDKKLAEIFAVDVKLVQKIKAMNESMNSDEAVVKAILKNKHYKKNAKVRGDEIYFEMAETAGAIRLSKKIANMAKEEINGSGGGALGYYDSIEIAILSVNRPIEDTEPQAYIKLVFKGDIPANIIKLAKASEDSDAQIKKELDIINKR